MGLKEANKVKETDEEGEEEEEEEYKEARKTGEELAWLSHPPGFCLFRDW